MDANGVTQIVQALRVVHSPVLSNTERHSAQQFLEQVKQEPELPQWGYELALPSSGNDAIVKHFGLQLLQHAIKTHYLVFDSAKQLAVRRWVVELAGALVPGDENYIREKIGDLWVLIAKRVWGSFLTKLYASETPLQPAELLEQDALEGWSSMDQDLLELWNHNMATRELLLVIFRTLFEDVYILDDAVATKRSNVLRLLCLEVVTLQQVLDQFYNTNPRMRMCRAGQEGWLHRWGTFLGQCIEMGWNDRASVDSACRILETLKTCLHWVLPPMVRQENLLEKLSSGVLMSGASVRVKTLATDCLHSLFTRDYSDTSDFEAIVGSVFTSEGVRSLFEVYSLIKLDPEAIDEEAYVLLKKLVEMMVLLSDHLSGSTFGSGSKSSRLSLSTLTAFPPKTDFAGYLELVLATTSHDSVIVLGLSLQFWTSVLRYDEISDRPEVQAILPRLLETAGLRLVLYDDMREDHVARRYLEIDFDLTLEQQTFLSNYRKFVDDIVRITVCKQPELGLRWLEQRLDQFFLSEMGHTAITSDHLDTHSDAYIYCFLQFAIIEACVKGISRWRVWYSSNDKEARQSLLNALVESLGERLLALTVADALLLRKQIQTLVQFLPLLKDQLQLVFRILEKTLQVATYEYPPDALDEVREAIRDLRTLCGTELNRLAYIMPELLRVILNELERVVMDILALEKVSEHECVLFKLFLLIVLLRLHIQDLTERFAKIVDPELAAWQAPDTMKGLADLHWFMERLGIVKIAEYFRLRGITASTDLLSAPIDEAGMTLKTDLKKHWLLVFPIRATRILVQYLIERIEHDTPEFQELLALWKPRIQPIVPHILQLMTQIQAYHNPANWTDLPEEVQMFVRHTTRERFWQEGISIQTKELFMHENVRAMHTLRDFADSVGHSIRYTREYVFLTIGLLCQLEDTLYLIPNVAQMLWTAVAGDTTGVTLHSWRHMINLVLRNLIKNVPVEYVSQFMGELLPLVLPQLDQLLVEHWDRLYQAGMQLDKPVDDDQQLSEEMMEEHLLRQLTYVVDRMVIDLVGQLLSKNLLTERQRAIRKLVLGLPQLLAPFVRLCCHLVTFKDTKCCFNTILVVRFFLDEVLLRSDEADKFVCDQLMRALLQVLMDDFFADAHAETAYALTLLYVTLRTKSSYPLEVLHTLLPGLTDAQLRNFEVQLGQQTALRQQRLVVLELIQLLQVRDDAQEKRERSRQLDPLYRKKKAAAMEDPLDGSLANLFGE